MDIVNGDVVPTSVVLSPIIIKLSLVSVNNNKVLQSTWRKYKTKNIHLLSVGWFQTNLLNFQMGKKYALIWLLVIVLECDSIYLSTVYF